MIVPSIIYISRKEYEGSENIYKIIVHDDSITFGYFELNNKKYYISWISPDVIKVDFKLLEKENYLLVGVDLRAVVLCSKTGKILFSLGLFSFFKGFEDTNDLQFTIFSELEDIVINKNGLSISKTIPHDLEF
jgi:hypothetical protein